MKAIGLPPSDPRVSQMNDAQWLWCYFNEMEDYKEDSEKWRDRLDFISWFINPEMAKSVREQRPQEREKKTKREYKKEGVHNSSVFEKEVKAASLGYDPEKDGSVDEFLSKFNNENIQEEKIQEPPQEVDILNGSFEDLLNSGEFSEVVDVSQEVGDPHEHEDDFLTRAMMFQEDIENRERIARESKMKDTPVGLTEEEINELNNERNSSEEEGYLKYTSPDEDDDDLDFFDLDDDE